METKRKVKQFYPNACDVCYATTNLKRCSGCQMISYCSSSHQKEHWPEHKAICRIIAAMMKELSVSHLFEKMRGADFQRWQVQRCFMMFTAQQRSDKIFTYAEQALFKFSRSCFVCHESRQWLLKNCPNCPSASFCQEHLSSTIHDEDCARIRETFETGLLYEKYDTKEIVKAMDAAVAEVKPLMSRKRQITMHEFLSTVKYDYNDSFNLRLAEEIKVHISCWFTTPLTAHLALQKLKFSGSTELTLHVRANHDFAYMWEIILHLWPQLKTLNILFCTSASEMEENVPLCHQCRLRRKKINVKILLKSYDVETRKCFREPDILIDCDVNVKEYKGLYDLGKILQFYTNFKCPILVTTASQADHEELNKMVTDFFGSTKIFYEGSNPFNSLSHHIFHEDGRVGSTNQCMIILKSGSQPRQRQTSPIVEAPKTSKTSSKIRNLFYSSVCHVCGAVSSEPVTCKRCRMISYCGKSHQDEHQAQHRELCKVILGMLTESGAPNLFDKLKTSDSNLWLRAKLELLTKARTRLGRDLVDFEMQMFLFPKTCFVCHESDSSVLRNCKCGVHLCKNHKNDEEHKILCPDLSLAFKLAITERSEITIKALVRKRNHEGNKTVPISMDECIDSFIQIETRVPNTLKISNFEKILLSDFLTRPLTLLWCLKKFNDKSSDSLTVHVIGATNPEVEAQKYWKIILYHFQSLKTLKIIFIGPEITRKTFSTRNELEFPASSFAGKSFQVEIHALKYEDYFRSKSFVKPGIVIGFNLNLRESDFAIFKNNTWKETIMCLKKIDAPFILTAGSKLRAEKDHEKFCQLFEKNVPFLCCEENPFAGLIPERDYETEKLIYCNKYMIIYDKLYEKKRSKCKG